MGTTVKTILVTLIWIASAVAAEGKETEGSGLLLSLFIGFGALIIVFQLVPSLILFGSMLKGLFTRTAKETALSTSEENDK
ncbi:MAG TPA: hypothetical protein VI389_11280 [Geobacteraceae bacterium]